MCLPIYIWKNIIHTIASQEENNNLKQFFDELVWIKEIVNVIAMHGSKKSVMMRAR